MKILFLNIADTGALGRDSVETLQQRYGDDAEIVLLNAYEQAMAYRDNPDYIPADFSITEEEPFDEIYVAAHGLPEETECCFFQDEHAGYAFQQLLTAEQLANFVQLTTAQLGQPSGADYDITLSICYAARSDMHDVHHIESRDAVPLDASFAARFTQQIAARYNYEHHHDVIAYTGGVGFTKLNESSTFAGHIKVETEEAVRLRDRVSGIREEWTAARENTLRLENELFTDIEAGHHPIGNMEPDAYVEQQYQQALQLDYQITETDAEDYIRAVRVNALSEQAYDDVATQRAEKRVEYGKVKFSCLGQELKINHEYMHEGQPLGSHEAPQHTDISRNNRGRGRHCTIQ